jgi:hypothetical protein
MLEKAFAKAAGQAGLRCNGGHAAVWATPLEDIHADQPADELPGPRELPEGREVVEVLLEPGSVSVLVEGEA